MGFHSHGIKHGIRAPHGFLLQTGCGVLVEVQSFDSMSACHGASLCHRVHPDDPVPAMDADAGGQLAHRPEAEHGKGSSFGDRCVFNALPGRGQDIR